MIFEGTIGSLSGGAIRVWAVDAPDRETARKIFLTKMRKEANRDQLVLRDLQHVRARFSVVSHTSFFMVFDRLNQCDVERFPSKPLARAKADELNGRPAKPVVIEQPKAPAARRIEDLSWGEVMTLFGGSR